MAGRLAGWLAAVAGVLPALGLAGRAGGGVTGLIFCSVSLFFFRPLPGRVWKKIKGLKNK